MPGNKNQRAECLQKTKLCVFLTPKYFYTLVVIDTINANIVQFSINKMFTLCVQQHENNRKTKCYGSMQNRIGKGF